MTEFSFDLFITPVPTKFVSKFSIYKTMPYWSAMHLGNVLAWTPILVTYNGIHVERENIERGPPPENFCWLRPSDCWKMPSQLRQIFQAF